MTVNPFINETVLAWRALELAVEEARTRAILEQVHSDDRYPLASREDAFDAHQQARLRLQLLADAEHRRRRDAMRAEIIERNPHLANQEAAE